MDSRESRGGGGESDLPRGAEELDRADADCGLPTGKRILAERGGFPEPGHRLRMGPWDLTSPEEVTEKPRKQTLHTAIFLLKLSELKNGV